MRWVISRTTKGKRNLIESHTCKVSFDSQGLQLTALKIHCWWCCTDGRNNHASRLTLVAVSSRSFRGYVQCNLADMIKTRLKYNLDRFVNGKTRYRLPDANMVQLQDLLIRVGTFGGIWLNVRTLTISPEEQHNNRTSENCSGTST